MSPGAGARAVLNQLKQTLYVREEKKAEANVLGERKYQTTTAPGKGLMFEDKKVLNDRRGTEYVSRQTAQRTGGRKQSAS
jgi:hypothetical protein